jgi:AraC-like DNA-binding protein
LPIPAEQPILLSMAARRDGKMSDLAEAVRHYTDARTEESPFATAIGGLILLRSSHAKPPAHNIFKPALCIVAQGVKCTTFGDKPFEYRAGQALVVSVGMPSVGRVTEASPDKPFLGILIEFDLPIMRDVLEGLDTPPKASGSVARSVFVTDFRGPLEDCALRLVHLLDTPRAIPTLAPMIMREICYWLLTGPNGGDVAQMALSNSHEQRVINAIHSLRDRFAEPVRIDELAQVAQMSPSAFHRHFKTLTSLTPLQYQKQLRLLEARRLMVFNAVNVETAAFEVGYESPSQFSREYSRMFGAPPKRDSENLKTVPALE